MATLTPTRYIINEGKLVKPLILSIEFDTFPGMRFKVSKVWPLKSMVLKVHYN